MPHNRPTHYNTTHTMTNEYNAFAVKHLIEPQSGVEGGNDVAESICSRKETSRVLENIYSKLFSCRIVGQTFRPISTALMPPGSSAGKNAVNKNHGRVARRVSYPSPPHLPLNRLIEEPTLRILDLIGVRQCRIWLLPLDKGRAFYSR
jgi:hypothetical protein